MKKSFLLAIIGALMAFSLSACSGDPPQAGNNNNEQEQNDPPDIENPNLNKDAAYTIILESDRSISMGHNDSAQVFFKLVNADTQEPVADAGLLLTLDMSVSKSASFSRSSNNKTSIGVYTESDGVAGASIYSAAKNATGTLTVSLPEHDCNELEITISIHEEGTGTGDIEDNTTGNVFVTLNNSESLVADSAELFIKEIENSSSVSSLCDDFMAGYGIGNEDELYIVNRLSSIPVEHTFRNLTAGKKVVVWAVGFKNNSEVAKACAESTSTVSATAPISVDLTFEDLPPNLDNDYDVMLGIDLTKIMPETWLKWFNLVDNIFTTPVGTAIYYALWAWETNAADGIPSFTIPVVNIKIDIWEIVTGNYELNELLINCEMVDGTKTGACPSFNYLLGEIEVFPWAIQEIETALENIENFGPVYNSIKAVGQDILEQAQNFNVGARFELAMEDDNTLSITETWTHVVWTWRLNDTSADCPNGSTCGRHAFEFSKNGEYSDSIVNKKYSGNVAANATNDGYTVTLPSNHAFILKYGALLKILINDVVVPQIMINDKDHLNTDGENVVVNGDESLGDLLNYWIPCGKVSTAVHNWLGSLSVGGYDLGALATGLISQEKLDEYCELGLNTAGNFAMDKLAELVVDADIKVRAGSSFELNALDAERAPTVLENLDYNIGLTVEEINDEGHVVGEETYDAHLTGEGIPAVTPLTAAHCAEFLNLSAERAEAACGN